MTQNHEEGMLLRDVPMADFEPIHTWFSLTYANYLVLPRSVLQSMPNEWQARLVKLLNEMEEVYGGLDWPTYAVNARERHGGRFIKDPIPHYNRGRTRVPPCPWQPPLSRDPAAVTGSTAPND